MKTAFRLATISLLVFSVGVCHASASGVEKNADTANSPAGTYICDSIPLHLFIKTDGTYEALFQQPPALRREHGVWKFSGEDIILNRTNGETGFSIQRLQPDRENPGHLIWMFPVGSGGGGAITRPVFTKKPD